MSQGFEIKREEVEERPSGRKRARVEGQTSSPRWDAGSARDGENINNRPICSTDTYSFRFLARCTRSSEMNARESERSLEEEIASSTFQMNQPLSNFLRFLLPLSLTFFHLLPLIETDSLNTFHEASISSPSTYRQERRI